MHFESLSQHLGNLGEDGKMGHRVIDLTRHEDVDGEFRLSFFFFFQNISIMFSFFLSKCLNNMSFLCFKNVQNIFFSLYVRLLKVLHTHLFQFSILLCKCILYSTVCSSPCLWLCVCLPSVFILMCIKIHCRCMAWRIVVGEQRRREERGSDGYLTDRKRLRQKWAHPAQAKWMPVTFRLGPLVR